MKEAEKEYIRTRFYELCKNTVCGADLLNFLYSKGTLSMDEMELIDTEGTTTKRSQKLYEIIQKKTNAFVLILQGLKETKQSVALEILVEPRETDDPGVREVQKFVKRWLEEQPPTSMSCCKLSEKGLKTNIKFNVHPPVVSFTGRKNELDRLHQMVLRSVEAERLSVVSQVTTVGGLGGIGKTQLAREYVRIKENDFDGNVLWMNAESEEILYDSFKKLAREELNILSTGTNARIISGAVYNYFKGMKALFVLDNAERVPWLKQFIPETDCSHNLFFLITSRDREWDRGVEVLSLDGLLEDEAMHLIQAGLGIDTNDPVQKESVRNLAQTLQCFPLALQQAIAYIYEQRKTRSDYFADTYLKDFNTKQLEVLSYREENTISVDTFMTTTATTWSMTLDKIVDEPNIGGLACIILNIIAYLQAENISRDLFYPLQHNNHWLDIKLRNIASYYFGWTNKQRNLVPGFRSIAEIDLVTKEQTNAAVSLLVKYSMLNGKDGQSILSVHRLVQAVTRNQLVRDGTQGMYLRIALRILEVNDNKFSAENISHALIAWRSAVNNDIMIFSNYSRQINKLLWKLREGGRHDEGLRFGNEALNRFKNMFGEHHLRTLFIQRMIGIFLHEQGYFDKAVSVFQDIQSKANRRYREDTDLSLVTKEDLGNSLKRSGNYKEALKILKEVLDKRKTIFGDNHSSTLICEGNYGAALIQSGNLTEAEKIFQRILKIYIAKGKENSPIVLYSQSNLSTIYSKIGNNEKAIELCRTVYEKLNAIWVESVDLFAAVCWHLGCVLNADGEFEEALEILEGSIEKIQNQVGSKYLKTLVIQQEIGRSYGGLRNYNKALGIFQNVHQGFASLSGKDSLLTLHASKEVAITLSLLGEHSEAPSKYGEVLPEREPLLGKENWNELVDQDWGLSLQQKFQLWLFRVGKM